MNWFGPPLPVTGDSTWPWIDHLVSGLPRMTKRAIHTRFRCGYARSLTSPYRSKSQTHYAKGMQSHHKGAPTLCRHMISGTFHSPHGVLFHLSLTVLCAVGFWLVFSLGEWSPRIQTEFHVFRPTWDTRRSDLVFAYRSFTFFGWAFQLILLTFTVSHSSPATPECKHSGLGSSAFARHYLRNLFWFLFLWVLRCFTSPGIASVTYVFSYRWYRITGTGFPHSDTPGSKRYCRSPRFIAAWRVLHRLSEPRHPSCALSSLTTKKTLVYYAKLYLSFTYNINGNFIPFSQIFKELCTCVQNLLLYGLIPSLNDGGRTWIWTMDLVLIRDAL